MTFTISKAFTIEQRLQMIKLYYQNECLLLHALRSLYPFDGNRGGLSQSTLKRLVVLLETIGLLINLPTLILSRNAKSAEKIVAVRQTVQQNPRQSIHRRA